MNETTPDAGRSAFEMDARAKTAFSALFLAGLLTFLWGVFGPHPERAWQAYLINFLLWSSVAQGGLLFSAVMHIVKARWSGPLAGVSHAFAAFFPVSFVLFLLLLLGKDFIFPWIAEDLHGKEAWLNFPFLYSRDLAGLLLLYGIGFAYLFYALGDKLQHSAPEGKIREFLYKRWKKRPMSSEQYRRKVGLFSILYVVAFALVLSLLGYDLVMSMDPHWYSTLFGAYTFVKAFYAGLGGLIIAAAWLYVKKGASSGLKPSHFYDIGRLFFGFCLVWADFFYVQFVVIWYGNIPEETAYIIERTMTSPWSGLAWTVLAVTFVIPFFVLLNRSVKAKPMVMIPLCALTLAGIWLEHLLLLGPAINRHSSSLPLHAGDLLITAGFLALLVFSVGAFMKIFPEIYRFQKEAGPDQV